MSVERTDYIIYGWKFDWWLKDEFGEEYDFYDDKYERYTCGGPDEKYIIIPDGMAGEYTVFGELLLQGGDKYEGFSFEEVPIKTATAEELKVKYAELFNNVEQLPEPKVFIFSHFS